MQHTYKKTGVYNVIISGECDNLHGYNGNTEGGNKRSQSLVKSLWGVCVPKNCQSPLKYAYGSFFGCENMRYLGKNVFKNLKDCKKIPHLFDGAAIEYFYDYTLQGAYNLTDVEYAFEACQMTGISNKLFSWCPKITSVFHTFHRCNKLKEIPQGLFDYTPNLTNAGVCFKCCTSVTSVPQKLFSKCPKLNSVYECFCGGRWNGDNGYNRYMSIDGNLPQLWDKHYWDSQEYTKENENNTTYDPQFQIGNISHTRYAAGCIDADNYKEAVLNGWV